MTGTNNRPREVNPASIERKHNNQWHYLQRRHNCGRLEGKYSKTKFQLERGSSTQAHIQAYEIIIDIFLVKIPTYFDQILELTLRAYCRKQF